MKTIFSTLALLLVCSFSAVAQTTTTTLAQPTTQTQESGTLLGSKLMDLSILSAPQPDMTYATDADGSAVEVTYWLVGQGTTEEEVITLIDADPVMTWAANDPAYKDASQSYVYEKVGAMAVWVGEESGLITGNDATVILETETTAGVSTTENSYEIVQNGENTEVYVVYEDGKS